MTSQEKKRWGARNRNWQTEDASLAAWATTTLVLPQKRLCVDLGGKYMHNCHENSDIRQRLNQSWWGSVRQMSVFFCHRYLRTCECTAFCPSPVVVDNLFLLRWHVQQSETMRAEICVDIELRISLNVRSFDVIGVIQMSFDVVSESMTILTKKWQLRDRF